MTKPRSITIVYEGPLPSVLSKNRRGAAHWSKVHRATKVTRETGQGLILEALQNASIDRPREGTVLFERAHIALVQHWCGTGLDADGLAASSAPLVDALMDMDIIRDDSPKIVTRSYGHVRVPHRTETKVVITVTEMPS